MKNELAACHEQDFTQIIFDETEQAYAEFLAEHPDIPDAQTPWDSPYCFDIIRRLQPKLADRGILTAIRSGGGQRHGLDDTHEFLETLETVDEIVICPTWQQIVPDHVKLETPRLPRVLIVPRANLEEVLSFYQVPHIMQLMFNIREDPEAPWGWEMTTPPSASESDAMLTAIRSLLRTLRPPHH